MARDENTKSGQKPVQSVVQDAQPIPDNDDEFEGASGQQQLVLSEQMSELSLRRSQNDLISYRQQSTSNVINIYNGNGIHIGQNIVMALPTRATNNQPSKTDKILRTRTIDSRY
jgi:hypothetical protein